MNNAPLNPLSQGQGLNAEQARRASPLSGSANAKIDPTSELRVHAEIRLLELRIAGAYEVVQQLTQRLESAGVLRANPPATAENRATGVHADVPMAAHLAAMSVFAAAMGHAIQDVLDRLEI